MRLFAFQGIRYSAGTGDNVGKFVAPPYDQINDALRDKLQGESPYHFAHLTRPKPGVSDNPYQEALRLHEAWFSSGVLTEDREPSLYPYAIALAHGGERLGLCGLVGLEEPQSGIIRAHEQTLDKPLADRLELLRTMRVDLEPSLFLPDDGGALDRMLFEDSRAADPLAVHVDGDGHHHKLFRVSDPARIRAYQDLLRPLPVAIADGHHRYKTAQIFAQESHAEPTSAAATKLAVITSLSSPNLKIDPIHRALKDRVDLVVLERRIAHRSKANASNGRALAAEVAAAPSPALGVWQSGKGPEIWWLDPRQVPATTRPSAARLSVVLLQDVLFPALGLAMSASTDGTVIYRADPEELARMVGAGEVGVGFFTPPMLPSEFSAAIAHGDLLPPKSTRFLPKAFSGLVWSRHQSSLR